MSSALFTSDVFLHLALITMPHHFKFNRVVCVKRICSGQLWGVHRVYIVSKLLVKDLRAIYLFESSPTCIFFILYSDDYCANTSTQ